MRSATDSSRSRVRSVARLWIYRRCNWNHLHGDDCHPSFLPPPLSVCVSYFVVDFLLSLLLSQSDTSKPDRTRALKDQLHEDGEEERERKRRREEAT